ncbi:bifunctional folylpolyglutamate synthase/dihydrofolate synthase [Erythrobacter crassostreae]|uniref:Bifunctional folylpolyglutamate synthase/dihydrofolate synthase n=1 Tax=Erythrobacter crassostreae TaxID=2828328 RepID=A0A9X1JLL6_9SPHN|nr:folylpolyglutamate synthase/dihydrofolate synthase family protein [Erythrobacter crassostrea]MBV7260171.1 bifunctional folylpolyglutamate synthase/dihydrofolate synthase [Erythrobacter crassostrea]
MRDMGSSDDPRVQAQLDRLSGLSIQRNVLGLDAVRTLLSRLGDPHKRLPPVFHVAGTNGKGSTCAFMRAMLEAEGYRVHVTTSPHLVRYNERFRVAGKLIEDGRLAELLEEVFDAAEGLGCSFFEITIAAAFVEFARVPADACVVEVGLGGRLDATNVLEPDVLAACGIAALGIDHEKFLLAPEDGVPTEPIARIAFEKAGIAKKNVPLLSVSELSPESKQIQVSSASVGSLLFRINRDWHYSEIESGSYRDDQGTLTFPPLGLLGMHQMRNAALAIAMLRHQKRVSVSPEAIILGLQAARWPARLQPLANGPLVGTREVILDGGHNANAGAAISKAVDGPLHLVLGMLDNKDSRSFIGPFCDRIRTLTVVPVPNHDAHPASAFGADAKPAVSLEDALLNIPHDDCPILIAGSLYLAGEALRLNDEIPD